MPCAACLMQKPLKTLKELLQLDKMSCQNIKKEGEKKEELNIKSGVIEFRLKNRDR